MRFVNVAQIDYALLIDTVFLVSLPCFYYPTHPPQGIDRTPPSRPPPPQKIKRIIFYQYQIKNLLTQYYFHDIINT